MGRRGLFDDFRSPGMPPPDFNPRNLIVLTCAGKPMAHQTCRHLHPCRECRGDGCEACAGKGVGRITGDPSVVTRYCPCCHATNIDFFEELQISAGDLPAPEPKVPAPKHEPKAKAKAGKRRDRGEVIEPWQELPAKAQRGKKPAMSRTV